ncbi:MAG: hydantoinase/oxoprolinase family protein, partial [Rhodococcus sp. (in: high G+C Gram-positive bacteria)]|uniref:hydantoinase/oxoprolinase family protein n=1 Tax=Rhodococcus sp. TaxID=1831 RepID=UPI003BAE1775
AKSAVKHPFRIVFSGPAAGTVSSAHFGKLIGASELLCADIGGTSCDISLVTGSQPFVDTTIELEHDLVVNTLSNEISAIGAGGGSIVTINGAGDLLVGPGSAGANPGPACYGLGGAHPTTTDTCLLMGIVDGQNFAGGQLTLDPELSRQAFERLDTNLTLEQRISFAFHIGIHNIAEGLTNVAVSHGIDPRDYSLIAYGAAGPMLLPATLEYVKAKEIVVPPHPGLFSALGLVSSDLVYAASKSAYHTLTPDVAEELTRIFQGIEDELRASIPEAQRDSVVFARSFDGRLVGQSWETPFVKAPAGDLTAESIDEMIEAFHETYLERSGNRFDFIPVQAATFRVQAVVPTPKVEYPVLDSRTSGGPVPTGTTTIKYLAPDDLQANVYERSTLMAGDVIDGPAVIREALSTTFVVPNQQATVGKYGELRIRQL